MVPACRNIGNLRPKGTPVSAVEHAVFPEYLPGNWPAAYSNYLRQSYKPAYNSTRQCTPMDSSIRQRLDRHAGPHLMWQLGRLFFNPQYGHCRNQSIEVPVQRRYALGSRTARSQLTMDFNYTYSHSMDDRPASAEFNQYGRIRANFILIRLAIRLVCRLRFRHSTYVQLQHRLGSAIRPGPQVFFRFKGLRTH